MANSLSEEIRSLSDDELNEQIETFEKRVETTRDYLDDCDSMDISMVMRGKLQEYSHKLQLLREERSRRNSTSNNEHPAQHPARPTGVKITRENQIKTYQAYIKCPDFLKKIPTINNPVYRRELANRPFAMHDMLCKEDCIFPTCPFYDGWSIINRVVNHPDDYDEWVVQGYEDRFK